MKRFVLVAVISFFSNWSFGQIIFDKSHYDFGEVNEGDTTYADFILTNASDKIIEIKEIILPYGTSVRKTTMVLAPDSSSVLRIKYTPKRIADFQADVLIYVSSEQEPITLTLRGHSKYENFEANMESPSFKEVPPPVIKQTELSLRVRDIVSKKGIASTNVKVVWDGLIYKTEQTNKKGLLNRKLKDDIYYFIASAEGYRTRDASILLNDKNKELLIELYPEESRIEEPVKEDTVVAPPIVKVDTPKIELQDTIAKAIEEQAIEEIVEVLQDTIVAPVVTEEIIPEPKSNELSINEFAPNNVVFLIDVSVSMKQEDRLDLLKAAMIKLLNPLRPIDKIAIVTYASKVEVALPTTHADKKGDITQIIRDLQAGGYTAGEKGLKKAYDIADNAMIPDGNNQVIIATDGGFNTSKTDEKIAQMAQKYAEKGITLTVVGVKNKKAVAKSMKDMAQNGQGNFIHIEDYEDTESLLEEIKLNSKKK